MHKKFFLKVGLAIFICVTAMPLVIGLLVKYNYDELIAFYNSQGNVHIEITQYKRHWFNATATLSVSISRPMLEKTIRLFDANSFALPEKMDFSMEQHIQYGPILYRDENDSLTFALAYLYSKIKLSHNLEKFIQPINNLQPIILLSDNLSFSGKFQRNIRFEGFRMFPANGDGRFEMYGLSINADIWPHRRQIKAKVKIDDILITNSHFTFIIPGLQFLCDQHLSENDLWVGDSSFSLPTIYLRQHNGAPIWFLGFVSQGSLQEDSGLLSGAAQFKDDKIQLNNITLGPLALHASIHDLDAAATAKLVSNYQDSLASSALIDGLVAMLNQQSSFAIDSFQAKTPSGNLTFNGEIKWPHLSTTPTPTLLDVFHYTDMQASLRVTERLLGGIVRISSAFFGSQQPLTAADIAANNKQNKILSAQNQNEILINMLMQDQQLSAPVAKNLLALEKKNVSLDNYLIVLNGLVANKQISASTMQMLRLQYSAIQFINMPSEQRREHTEKLMQAQLAQWLQAGYLLRDKNDYTAEVQLQNGVIKINGKPL